MSCFTDDKAIERKYSNVLRNCSSNSQRRPCMQVWASAWRASISRPNKIMNVCIYNWSGTPLKIVSTQWQTKIIILRAMRLRFVDSLAAHSLLSHSICTIYFHKKIQLNEFLVFGLFRLFSSLARSFNSIVFARLALATTCNRFLEMHFNAWRRSFMEIHWVSVLMSQDIQMNRMDERQNKDKLKRLASILCM